MNKEFEKWALVILNKYQKVLLLTDHAMTFEFDKDIESKTMFQHGFNYPYKTTAITYGTPAVELWKNKSKEDLKQGLIHELCHSLTDPLYCKAVERYVTKDCITDERERLTDHIANIIYKHI